MPLPSGDTVTLNSGDLTIAGQKEVSVSITLQDNGGGTDFDSDYDYTLLDIGDLEMNIDVAQDTDDITEYLYTVPSFEFEIASPITSTIDFGDMLNQLILEDLIEIRLTYDGDTDLFLCQKTDVSYDLLERKASITCYSPFKYAEQINTYDVSGRIRTVIWENDLGTEFEYNLITQRDLIEAYLDTLGSGLTQKIQSSFELKLSDINNLGTGASLDLTSYVTDAEGNEGSSAPEGQNGKWRVDDFDDARSKVLKCGISEAAIVGTLFGEAFYVRRDYSGSDVGYSEDITADDLEDFNVEFSARGIYNLDVSIGGELNSFGNLSGAQSVDITIDDFVDQTLVTEDTNYTPPFLLETTGIGVNGEVDFATLSSTAFSSYERVFSIADTIKWSGTIFGVEKVKPYYFLELDTNISKYLSVSNNKVRLSSVTFNLKEDKVEFEGYSI